MNGVIPCNNIRDCYGGLQVSNMTSDRVEGFVLRCPFTRQTKGISVHHVIAWLTNTRALPLARPCKVCAASLHGLGLSCVSSVTDCSQRFAKNLSSCCRDALITFFVVGYCCFCCYCWSDPEASWLHLHSSSLKCEGSPCSSLCLSLSPSHSLTHSHPWLL